MNPISLVTGGAGFIGSHVAQYLLNQGHQVIVLDDLSGGMKSNVPSLAKFVQGSITNTELINQLFEEYNFDFVYHLAAYAAEGLSPYIRKFNYENNLIGSINLINASVNHNVKCFVFTSSIAVYGSKTPPFTESMAPQPEDSYGIAKYAVELDLKDAKERFGLNYVIFRPHNVYGVNQNLNDKFRNVVGIFMRQIILGEPLTIFGDGFQKRAFTSIHDVAPAIAMSVNKSEALNQVFNIGSDVTCSVNDLAQIVWNALNGNKKVLEIKYLEERKEVVNAIADHSKFKTVFGQETTIPLIDGINEMANWAKTINLKPMADIKNIEIIKNLPESWK
ncbi:MAG: NAD-dependent epimerase/dehydratase family protein [Salibacteraceae bacterium]